MFKVRIDCTTKENLAFNNGKIQRRHFKKIIQHVDPIKFPALECIYLLTKTIKRGGPTKESESSGGRKRITLKSLEMTWSWPLSEKEFREFVEHLQNVGFSSTNKNKIQLVDNSTANIIYSFTFQTLQKKNVVQRQKTQKYTYYQTNLYKR
jgi:hypothetical protein